MGEDRGATSSSSTRTGWRTNILTGIITISGIGGLVMLVLYGFEKSNLSGASSVIPIISARDGPTKLRPENPGGMEIYHQDKNVYNRIDPTARLSKVEKLLPSPDLVMPKPGTRKLKRNKKESKINSIKSFSKLESSPKKSKSLGEATKKKSIAEKNLMIVKRKIIPVPNDSLKGAYRVQFASLRKKSDAAASWKRLKDKYPALLVNLKPRIERTIIAGKGTFYRLQAGIFKNSESARALCNKAKTKNIGCFIVKLH
jgi:hypothetical protein